MKALRREAKKKWKDETRENAKRRVRKTQDRERQSRREKRGQAAVLRARRDRRQTRSPLYIRRGTRHAVSAKGTRPRRTALGVALLELALIIHKHAHGTRAPAVHDGAAAFCGL